MYPPLFKTIWMGFMFTFIQAHKVYEQGSLSFTLSIKPPFPTDTYSQTGLAYFCLSFFKMYINSSKEFRYGIWHMHILHFNQINPSCDFFFLYPPCLPSSTVFTGFHYANIIHRCNVFWYYSLSIILFLSCLSLVPSNSPTIPVIQYDCNIYYIYHILYVYIMYIFIYTFIF
jgi:hypothetical protein